MADISAPDYERFPELREALAAAQVAELEPGDALFYPAMWWHQVEALETFQRDDQLLVDHVPAATWTTPQNTLLHALAQPARPPGAGEARLARDVRLLRVRACRSAAPHLPEGRAATLGHWTRQGAAAAGRAAPAPQSLTECRCTSIADTRRHRRRRHGRLDRGGGPGAATGPAARHHAGGVRGDRHCRSGRSDHPDHSHVSYPARPRRTGVHARDTGDLQARHRFRELGAHSAIAISTPSAISASPPGWAASTTCGSWRRRRASAASSATTASSTRRAEAGKFAISETVADQLRVPLRCRPLRAVPAREIRAQGRQAHRRQDRARGAGRRERLRDRARHGRTARAWRATCSSIARAFAAC